MKGFDQDALQGRTAVVTGAAGGLGSAIMAQLCAMGANIVWVDYGLAPEHPFPAPLRDVLAACRSLFHNAEKLGIDPTRVGIVGDSAGGNLAAVTALMNRYGQLGHRFVCQILLYPCLDLTASLPSHRQFSSGYLLTAG